MQGPARPGLPRGATEERGRYLWLLRVLAGAAFVFAASALLAVLGATARADTPPDNPGHGANAGPGHPGGPEASATPGGGGNSANAGPPGASPSATDASGGAGQPGGQRAASGAGAAPPGGGNGRDASGGPPPVLTAVDAVVATPAALVPAVSSPPVAAVGDIQAPSTTLAPPDTAGVAPVSAPGSTAPVSPPAGSDPSGPAAVSDPSASALDLPTHRCCADAGGTRAVTGGAVTGFHAVEAAFLDTSTTTPLLPVSPLSPLPYAPPVGATLALACSGASGAGSQQGGPQFPPGALTAGEMPVATALAVNAAPAGAGSPAGGPGDASVTPD